jgi:site-specific DNA-methyltransferase (adenine-specific)
MQAYYEDKWVKIFHGDCREILPTLDCKVDLVLTDPPYPDQHLEYGDCDISFLDNEVVNCQQLVFWTAKYDFPLSYNAVHIWDKKTGCASEYERIFERNTERGNWKVFREYLINSTVAANYCHDIFTGHPSQKPFMLITKLIQYADCVGTVLDPFMGSGSTCYCAKKLNRYSIGIEIEERYCEISAKRCSQEVMELNV